MADKMQPWMRDAIAVCGDKLMADIVNDNRPPPRPAAPPSNVQIVGAGRTVEFDYGPAYRPYVPPKEDANATADRSGWQAERPLRPPEGLQHIDAMLDAEDQRWRLQRAREVAEAAALKKAEQKFLETKQRSEEKGKGSK
jgi:hypothetical protein